MVRFSYAANIIAIKRPCVRGHVNAAVMRPASRDILDERDRVAAFYRNVAGWCSVGLGVLAFFWTISNSFQTQAVRIAALVIGCAVALVWSVFAVMVHRQTMDVYTPVMAVAMLLTTVAPAVFLLVSVLATGEFEFAQNKQPR